MSVEKVRSASEALLSDFEDVRRLDESHRSPDATEAARDQLDADAVQLAQELERDPGVGGRAAQSIVEIVGRLRAIEREQPELAPDDPNRERLRAEIEQAARALNDGL